MLCNKKHLSEIFGISERTLSTFQTNGLPFVSGGPGKDNEYDTVTVFNWLQAKAKSANSADYYTEKARLTKAQADKEEIKVLEMRGQLLDANTVADSWAKQIMATRAKLLALPTKIAPLIVDKTVETAQFLLQDYIEEALNELANEQLTEQSSTESPETLETTPASQG